MTEKQPKTEEKEFKCPSCDFSSSKKNALDGHLRFKHPEAIPLDVKPRLTQPPIQAVTDLGALDRSIETVVKTNVLERLMGSSGQGIPSSDLRDLISELRRQNTSTVGGGSGVERDFLLKFIELENRGHEKDIEHLRQMMDLSLKQQSGGADFKSFGEQFKMFKELSGEIKAEEKGDKGFGLKDVIGVAQNPQAVAAVRDVVGEVVKNIMPKDKTQELTPDEINMINERRASLAAQYAQQTQGQTQQQGQPPQSVESQPQASQQQTQVEPQPVQTPQLNGVPWYLKKSGTAGSQS